MMKIVRINEMPVMTWFGGICCPSATKLSVIAFRSGGRLVELPTDRMAGPASNRARSVSKLPEWMRGREIPKAKTAEQANEVLARLLLAADALHPSDNSESLSLGAELTLRDALGIRLGYQSLFLQDSEVGLTGGAGFRSSFDGLRYHVDYAWADQGRLEDTHRFSFGILF